MRLFVIASCLCAIGDLLLCGVYMTQDKNPPAPTTRVSMRQDYLSPNRAILSGSFAYEAKPYVFRSARYRFVNTTYASHRARSLKVSDGYTDTGWKPLPLTLGETGIINSPTLSSGIISLSLQRPLAPKHINNISIEFGVVGEIEGTTFEWKSSANGDIVTAGVPDLPMPLEAPMPK